MPISILLVQVTGSKEKEAARAINKLSGAEVTETGKGFLVTAIDTVDTKKNYEVMETIEKMAYIMNVSLVMSADENAVGKDVTMEGL